MCAKPTEPFEAWAKPATEAFQFWISLFPVAPMFGVEWRFAKTVQPPEPPQFMKPFVAAFAPTDLTIAPVKSVARLAPVLEPAPEAPIEPAASPTGVFEPIAPVAKSRRPKSRLAEPMPEPEATPEPEAAAPDWSPVEPEPAPTQTAPEPAPEPEPEPTPEPVEMSTAPDPAPTDLAPEPETDPAPFRPAGLLAAPPAQPDDLKLLRGIGPGLERQLNALGVYTFQQLAGFSTDDLTWVDANLTAFKGRCFRDDWIGQARALMA